MIQQAIALAIIAIFIWSLNTQRKKNKIGNNEFVFWLIFWCLGAIAVLLIRQIDKFTNFLGISSGINFLLYIAAIVLFYLIFKLRLTIAKLDANLTELTRKITLS